MGLGDDLAGDVRAIFKEQWSYRDGRIIPETKNVGENNSGVRVEATILYADLSDSTQLVDTVEDWRAAEIYKAFLRCCAKIIRSEGGEIRSYDGDRVMGLFLGDYKNTKAVKVALRIHYAVRNIIQPAYAAAYPSTPVSINHCVGVDTSSVLAIRAGIRGSNDIAWIGKAANHAAKLTSLPHTHPSYITAAVFNKINDEAKYGGAQKSLMWEKRLWTPMNNAEIYRSTWWWKV